MWLLCVCGGGDVCLKEGCVVVCMVVCVVICVIACICNN